MSKTEPVLDAVLVGILSCTKYYRIITNQTTCNKRTIAWWGASWPLLVTTFYSDDKATKNEMGRACGTYWREGRCV